MSRNVIFIVSLSFLFNALNLHASDLSVVDIDGIGYQSVSNIKNHASVEWWVEMGSEMIVKFDDENKHLWPEKYTLVKTLTGVNIKDLAFQSLGHCDHSALDEKLHQEVDAIYTHHSSQIISIKNFTNRKQLYGHDSIVPFKKNSILSQQYSNSMAALNPQQKNRNIENLVNQVDPNRWFAQVEYLAQFDRMEKEDLEIAGEWIEARFQHQGMTTRRINLHSHYRGFNIVGFKQGTTRANDWYVIGAHLDSRNSIWSDDLPSPGAEDNASGCSGVIETANILSQYETEGSILFMCFIEEESGLLGSKDVVELLEKEGDITKVKAMLNMDMISYKKNDKKIAIAGTDKAEHAHLAQQVAANGTLYSDVDWRINLAMCCTDFLSFSRAGIPAVTSNQPDITGYLGYHSSNDLVENLNPELGSDVVKANLATLIDLVGVNVSGIDVIFINNFE